MLDTRILGWQLSLPPNPSSLSMWFQCLQTSIVSNEKSICVLIVVIVFLYITSYLSLLLTFSLFLAYSSVSKICISSFIFVILHEVCWVWGEFFQMLCLQKFFSPLFPEIEISVLVPVKHVFIVYSLFGHLFSFFRFYYT